MRLLLDTHVFLWYIGGARELSEACRDAIRDPLNDVYLSVVSLWEAIIKFQLGKLPQPEPPQHWIPRGRALPGIQSLPVDEASVARLANLPLLHRDPFDRLLICQALEHQLTLVTVDRKVAAYPVPVLDAR
jgi:PIN domain nuclease of toxin-antitoxin system